MKVQETEDVDYDDEVEFFGLDAEFEYFTDDNKDDRYLNMCVCGNPVTMCTCYL